MEIAWDIITNYIICTIALILILEQIAYLKKKRLLPGPTFVLPFIGNAISLVRNPSKFWEIQSSYAKSTPLGISSNYIMGRYIVYIYSSDLSRKVFINVRPNAFQLVGHPFGKKVFGEHSLMYMLGQEHKELRRVIAPNFNPRALQTYTNIQQRIIMKHLISWCEKSNNKSIPLRLLSRDLNLETSQTVFVGPYLKENERKRFNRDYNIVNVGVLALPINLPGFAFRKAKFAVDRLAETLAICVEESEKKMKSGSEPTCLIDFWMQENLHEFSGKPLEYTYKDMGGFLFAFLFAAQDASTSSLLWAITLLDSHPDVLDKVRKEVAEYWLQNDDVITGEQLREMKYTDAVAREVLSFRPPGTLIPHIADVDFPITKNYVIPKGTVVFPSVYDSSFQGFSIPDRFDPDRFLEREEDRVYKNNFLVFGAGPHQCVGQRYAINQLKLFIAMFSMMVDFQRDKTSGCDEFAYVPTIVPKDECMVSLSLR